MRRTLRLLGACAVLAAVITAAIAAPSQPAAPALAADPVRFVTGWIPNWSSTVVSEGTRALNAGLGHENLFAEVSPFAYSATAAGTISLSGTQTNLDSSITTLRNKGLKVVPSITDGTGKGVMAGILADPVTRAQQVAAIVALVQAKNFDGIDLDYEGFAFTDGKASWATTKPNWAAFVRELGATFDTMSPPRMLAVTVPPIWASGAQGYWVYGWQDPTLSMMPYIDRLRLMVYDWSVGQPGPIAPMSWVNDVLAYTKATGIDMAKVQVGVPTYGRSWATVTSGTCPVNASLTTTSVQMENALPLAATKGASPVRDASGEMKFTYDETFTGSRTTTVPAPVYVPPATRANTVGPAEPGALKPALRLSPGATQVTCTVRRTVFYPDTAAVVQRARAALAAGTAGIAIWALGYETPDLWTELATL